MFFKTKNGVSFNLNLVETFREVKYNRNTDEEFTTVELGFGGDLGMTLEDEDAKAFLDKVVSTPLSSLTKAVFT